MTSKVPLISDGVEFEDLNFSDTISRVIGKNDSPYLPQNP
jgi:hypothetical protein